MEWNKTWLAECNAMLYLGSSKDAAIELELAKKLKKIVYFNAESIPKTVRVKG